MSLREALIIWQIDSDNYGVHGILMADWKISIRFGTQKEGAWIYVAIEVLINELHGECILGFDDNQQLPKLINIIKKKKFRHILDIVKTVVGVRGAFLLFAFYLIFLHHLTYHDSRRYVVIQCNAYL